jgi:hypothetical protein
MMLHLLLCCGLCPHLFKLRLQLLAALLLSRKLLRQARRDLPLLPCLCSLLNGA